MGGVTPEPAPTAFKVAAGTCCTAVPAEPALVEGCELGFGRNSDPTTTTATKANTRPTPASPARRVRCRRRSASACRALRDDLPGWAACFPLGRSLVCFAMDGSLLQPRQARPAAVRSQRRLRPSEPGYAQVSATLGGERPASGGPPKVLGTRRAGSAEHVRKRLRGRGPSEPSEA